MLFKSSTRKTPDPEARHKFERAGFGKGPYRFIGQEAAIFQAAPDAPKQPGTSCDYCGTGIMGVFWLQSSENVIFKVGCDCLKKAAKESSDYPLQTMAARLMRKHNLEVRHAREEIKIRELIALFPKIIDRLKTLPHPTKWRSDRGETLADNCEWLIKNSGNAGKISLLKYLQSLNLEA